MLGGYSERAQTAALNRLLFLSHGNLSEDTVSKFTVSTPPSASAASSHSTAAALFSATPTQSGMPATRPQLLSPAPRLLACASSLSQWLLKCSRHVQQQQLDATSTSCR